MKTFSKDKTKVEVNKILKSIANDFKNKTVKKVDWFKIIKDTGIMNYAVIAETINESKYAKYW